MCVLGDVVVSVLRVRGVDWGVAAAQFGSGLGWVTGLLQVFGVGCVKVAVGVMVLKLAIRNWHRHVILGCICEFGVWI